MTKRNQCRMCGRMLLDPETKFCSHMCEAGHASRMAEYLCIVVIVAILFFAWVILS